MARFRVANVFDVSQTSGKPLPTLAQDLSGNVEQYEAFMDALKAVSNLPIVFEPMPDEQDGVCRFGEEIAIREGMSQIQTVSAAIHEMTHAKLHDRTLIVGDDGDAPEKKSRRTEEVEAESISYAVCQYFGIDTGDNSFGYVASWSKGKELKELNASLDTIRKTTTELIESIDGKFQEIVKERGIVIAVGEAQETIDDIITAPSFRETRNVGENVLMPLLFNSEGNLERTDKRTRVRIEPAIDKYQIYSREHAGDTRAYIMTDSGKLIDSGSTYDRLKDLELSRIDEFFSRNREIAEVNLQDPDAWVDYTAAAIANCIPEAEAHNEIVKAAREKQDEQERQERYEERKIKEKEKQEKLDVKMASISAALVSGARIDIEPDTHTDQNPLFALMYKHNIHLPPATKSWVNRNLKRSYEKEE
ncbi:hypothetical protein LJB90_02470 [Eubacteriales bacterium OttesenSCG-928-G02]|nr:hypothetical protein [Eubacteriales bacterium OttesenSCG-928-G02]